MNITVYGHTGAVGAQLYRWMKEQGASVAGVSLDRTDGEPGGEWAFLCLPTPTVNGVQDRSAIDDVMARVTAENVVIRSTVLPGTCAAYQAQYPSKAIYHWPEFLSARTAWHDFCNPNVRIIGCRYMDRHRWEQAFENEDLLPGVYSVMTDTNTSEAIKYAHNTHGAMQVIFANLLWDMCWQSGADFYTLKTAIREVGYIPDSIIEAYWDTERGGYRGYGGACFPKDVQALAGWLRGQAELLEGMEAANARLRALEASNG